MTRPGHAIARGGNARKKSLGSCCLRLVAQLNGERDNRPEAFTKDEARSDDQHRATVRRWVTAPPHELQKRAEDALQRQVEYHRYCFIIDY